MIQTMEARGMDAGMDPSDISAPLLSATVLLLRDGARGLEVFMVERSGRVGAFAGAMVFPGGKVAPEDSSAELRALADNGGDLDDAAFGFAVSSVREAFEECGVLLAHRDGATLTDAELAPLAGFRDAIGRNRIPFARFLADHGLRLDMAGLAPFSRWVTPVFRPKRFDTMFFLAAVPPDQTLSHDGSETVHGLWTRPQDVIDAADRDRKYSLYFATRLNLMDLALSGTVA
ncbi:MAG: NUDIX hydrolase, partial [Rhodospirillaceae bacterium]|nr:NUDIX hydrolase [Rhodospirillaceae bacterium]